MSFLRRIRDVLRAPLVFSYELDNIKINQGIQLSHGVVDRSKYSSLKDLEFRVFSQFGDDGIIQYLVHNIDCRNECFVEFGVADYFESNTRFLLHKDNWSGLVMDGSEDNIKLLKESYFFWRFDLLAKSVFITRENINELVSSFNNGDIGLMHIDLDGNDYWIWKELSVRPEILILEYNSTFGCERSITIPYNDSFQRSKEHYSNLYWGASLGALHDLCSDRGYAFLGCNSAGNNAYFIRRELLNNRVKEVSLHEGFVGAKYRESRNPDLELNYLNLEDREKEISGMPVFNTRTNEMEQF